VHIAHCSTKKSLAYVRQAKKKERFPGQITLEVTPHHACLSYEMKGLDKELVNPPLRSEKDRKAVVKAIQKGLVDVIATDHAPHTLEDKKNGACGFSGLETAFSLCYTELVKTGKLSLSKLSELMSSNPAQMLGLDKGFITEGADANLVLLDLEASFFVDSKDFKSKGKYTPIQGKKLFGRIM
jgi:dihydroorotase